MPSLLTFAFVLLQTVISVNPGFVDLAEGTTNVRKYGSADHNRARKLCRSVVACGAFHDCDIPVASARVVIMAAVSVMRMTIGNIAAITQSNVKRLLAYSSTISSRAGVSRSIA